MGWLEKVTATAAASPATTVHLRNVKIGAHGARKLAKLLSGSSIRELNMKRNNIGDAGVCEIAQILRSNTTLEALNLTDNYISDNGAHHLAKMLRVNTTLKELNLRNNAIGPKGARELAAALLFNNTLEVLCLRSNCIGDDGMCEIVDALRTNTTLKELNVRGNQIGDGGARALFNLLQSDMSLEEIHVKGNNISPGLLMEIQTLLMATQKHVAAMALPAALAPAMELQRPLIDALPELSETVQEVVHRGQVFSEAVSAVNRAESALATLEARRELFHARKTAMTQAREGGSAYAGLAQRTLQGDDDAASELAAARGAQRALVQRAMDTCAPGRLIKPPIYAPQRDGNAGGDVCVDTHDAMRAFSVATKPLARDLRRQMERTAAAHARFCAELTQLKEMLGCVQETAQQARDAFAGPMRDAVADAVEQACVAEKERTAAEAMHADLRRKLDSLERDAARAQAAGVLGAQLDTQRAVCRKASKQYRRAKFELEEEEEDGTATDVHRTKCAETHAKLIRAQEAEKDIVRKLDALANDDDVPEAAVALRRASAPSDDPEWDVLVRRGVALAHRSLDEFANVEHIGVQGGQSNTVHVLHKATQRWCVLKAVPRARAKQLYNEVRILAKLRHPNIIALDGVFRDKLSFYVQMPKMPGGNLREWMMDTHSEEDVRALFRGVVQGVLHLHDARIVHRDLKPENVLLTAEGLPVLCDFGISRDTEQMLAATVTDAGAGTLPYKAPEQLRGEGFSATTDMYALGLLLHELVFGTRYPVDIAMRAHPHSVAVREPREGDSDALAHALALMRELLQFRPEDRPEAFQVSARPYVRGAAIHTTAPLQDDVMESAVAKLLPFLDGRRARSEHRAVLHMGTLLEDMRAALAAIDATDSDTPPILRTEMRASGAVVPREDVYARVLRRACHADAQLFTTENGASFLPAPTATSEEQLWSFFAIGRMLAQALLDGVRVRDVPLPDAALLCVLCGEGAVTALPVHALLTLLRDYDAPLARQYTRLLVVDVNDYMLPGEDVRGADLDMNNGNKHDIVRRACIDKLVGVPSAALRKMREGFHSVDVVVDALEPLHDVADLRVLLASAVAVACDRVRAEEERARQAAVRAMVAELGHGHAFECPNGHVFFIGECGGAMQEGRCIECGAVVGGQHHRLRADNRHRGDVDGSNRPAWA